MNHYVIDTSVLIQHLIEEPHTKNVDALFERVGQETTLFAPEFCLLECTNVLWKHVRFNQLASSTAQSLVTDLTDLGIRLYPTTSLLPSALVIGIKYQLAIYDSLFIALAKHLEYPLITDDKKQAKSAETEGVILKAITDFV
jgi:predicted nucleic acid-binding protein